MHENEQLHGKQIKETLIYRHTSQAARRGRLAVQSTSAPDNH